MAFQEQFSQMAKNLLRDCECGITYTPQGGIARGINAALVPLVDSEFYGGTSEFDYDVREIEIFSGDDVNGVIAPKVTGRDGAGDSLTFSSGTPAGTWYVKKILADGRGNGAIHRLLIANSVGSLVDG